MAEVVGWLCISRSQGFVGGLAASLVFFLFGNWTL